MSAADPQFDSSFKNVYSAPSLVRPAPAPAGRTPRLPACPAIPALPATGSQLALTPRWRRALLQNVPWHLALGNHDYCDGAKNCDQPGGCPNSPNWQVSVTPPPPHPALASSRGPLPAHPCAAAHTRCPSGHHHHHHRHHRRRNTIKRAGQGTGAGAGCRAGTPLTSSRLAARSWTQPSSCATPASMPTAPPPSARATGSEWQGWWWVGARDACVRRGGSGLRDRRASHSALHPPHTWACSVDIFFIDTSPFIAGYLATTWAKCPGALPTGLARLACLAVLCAVPGRTPPAT